MSVNLGGQPSYVSSLCDWQKSWTGNSGQSASLYYSFNTSLMFSNPNSLTMQWNGGTQPVAFVGAITATEQSAAATAFGKWSDVAQLTFNATSSGDPQIVFLTGDYQGTGAAPGGTTWYSYSGSQFQNADIGLLDNAGDPTVGQRGFELIMHEIGHSLALDHPDGNPAELSRDVTIMSYSDGDVVDTGTNAVTPMIYDVAAIQFLYGANRSFHTGADTYTLTGTNEAKTIWDAGGTDTITVGASGNAVIDLRGGVDGSGNPHWSHLGNQYMAIAFDPQNTSGVVNIEKATGGSGNDTIYGGDVANTIQGGTGNDSIDAGAGDDVITYHAGDGIDTVEGGIGMDTYDFQLDEAYFHGDASKDFTITDADNRFEITTVATFVDRGWPTEGHWDLVSPHWDINGAGCELVFGSGGDDLILAYKDGSYMGVNFHHIVVSDVGKDLSYGADLFDYLWANNLIQISSDYSHFTVEVGTPVHGTAGADTITTDEETRIVDGAGGADTFVATSATAYDLLITDFSSSQGDHLDITAFDGTVDSLSDMNINNGSGSAMLTLPLTGDDVVVTLSGLTASQIGASYFISNTLNYGTGVTVNGTSGADTLGGGAANDIYNGNDGADSISSWTGNDSITGGNGNDTLYGSYGQDTVLGGDNADSVFGDAGNDSLSGDANADTIHGGDGSDTVLGGTGTDSIFGDGNNDALDGGTGADTMAGGTGDDAYTVDNTGDVVTENASEGTDAVSSSVTYTLSSNTENLTLTGASAINGTGNTLSNVLTGNTAANTFTSGDGNDVISGLAGNDTVHGDGGDDNASGGDDADRLYGDDGNDSINGDAGDDVIYGGIGNDSLRGGDGEDTISGEDGTDTIYGDDEDDHLYGGTGIDTIYGYGADDYIKGGDGTDRIYGKEGNDSLFGEADADTFYMQSGGGVDKIYDFEGAGATGGDFIRIESNLNSSGITDFASLSSHITYDDANSKATIDFGGGNNVTLMAGVGAGHHFISSDFSFY
jgi:Ca2+-binding RTX toxin-like protein